MSPDVVFVTEGRGDVLSLPFLVYALREMAKKRQLRIRFYPARGAGTKGAITRLPGSKDRMGRGNGARVRIAPDIGGLEQIVGQIVLKWEQGPPQMVAILVDVKEPDPNYRDAGIEYGAMEKRANLLTTQYGVPVVFFHASQAYESWLIAAIESLSGRHGIRRNLRRPCTPTDTSPANPKGWLRDRMRDYRETKHQPLLTRDADWSTALPDGNQSLGRFADWVKRR